jgi:hypothetical protein
MLTWREFAGAEPDLAEQGRGLLYQFGVGLGFLGTVDPSGAPRVHPVRPVLSDGGLYVFIVPGPKLRDLRRDGRYALHCFPPVDNEDGVQLRGTAREHRGAAIRDEVCAVICEESKLAELPAEHEPHVLFELLVDNCLATRTTGHGDYHPRHSIWNAPT